MKILFLVVALILSSCTINYSITHTQGTAEDVVDNTPTSTTDLSPTLSLPAL